MTDSGRRVPAADRYAIGLDIGGTKIAGGVVTADGTILSTLPPIATPQGGQDETVAALMRAVDDLRGRHPSVETIGVGAAGLVEWPGGYIRWAPNNAYRALPLRQLLERASGLPTTVDNDANTAAWAEARLHSSAAYLMFVTVGTGVGGGLVLDGRLYRGRNGIGAEVGHLIVDPYGDQRCGCGNMGCLEAVASGTALGRYGREAASMEETGLLATLARGAANVTGETVFAAASSGDRTARSIYARLGEWLGIGAASLATIFDLEVIMVGGGVASAGDLLLTPMRAGLERYLFARQHRAVPTIVPATLGVEAGWVGAGILALDQLTGDGARQPLGADPRPRLSPTPAAAR